MIMQPCKMKKSQLRTESYHTKDKRADLMVKPRTEQERVQNQQTREPRRSNGGVARQGFILLIQELFGEPIMHWTFCFAAWHCEIQRWVMLLLKE